MELQVIQNKIYEIRGQVWTELVAICDKLQGKIKHTLGVSGTGIFNHYN